MRWIHIAHTRYPQGHGWNRSSSSSNFSIQIGQLRISRFEPDAHDGVVTSAVVVSRVSDRLEECLFPSLWPLFLLFFGRRSEIGGFAGTTSTPSLRVGASRERIGRGSRLLDLGLCIELSCTWDAIFFSVCLRRILYVLSIHVHKNTFSSNPYIAILQFP